MDARITPFTASISSSDLDDLKQRLRTTRWPDPEPCEGWDQGIPLSYVQDLARYWADEYDWRKAEATLNQWPQCVVSLTVEDVNYDIHCIHRRATQPDAPALILTHGWPGSIFEFHKVIDALADPENHGGDASDAYHVIVPSLPGYGFSGKPAVPGTSVERIADVWDAMMSALGYERYFAQGGDWGSIVSCALALRHPVRCAGIHLNMVLAPPDPETLENPNEQEIQALGALDHYSKWDSGYSKQQSSRPQTLGYGLADSPVGQLAWIAEKFWAWTDCERDGARNPENAITRDEILDTVSLYWLTNSGASSARLYWESFNTPDMSPISIPVGASRFPKDIFLASERWARKRFKDLRYWSEPELGGHFAALEQPDRFIEDLRACYRLMR
ncbi:MAG: epoxide hydrolase family protein [Pseudomonadota bacterium]